MASNHLLPLYDEFLDYLIEKATPQEILAFKASPEAQAKAQDLIERNNAGTLTPDETRLLGQMLEFERMLSVLKAKALKASHESHQ
jgi:hypothetical protein